MNVRRVPAHSVHQRGPSPHEKLPERGISVWSSICWTSAKVRDRNGNKQLPVYVLRSQILDGVSISFARRCQKRNFTVDKRNSASIKKIISTKGTKPARSHKRKRSVFEYEKPTTNTNSTHTDNKLNSDGILWRMTFDYVISGRFRNKSKVLRNI